VHPKGTGAHGFFEVTEDVTQWTTARFLSDVGKRTPVFARMSTVAGELDTADPVRDPRGFALKFYTEEGNYDLVGNDTPVFFVRDASMFSDFIHSHKRMPDTGLRSNDMQWDFWTLSPESAHQVTILMSDRGTPRTLRHQNGYGSHTYSWRNAVGERFWVKYHFKTVRGIENFTLDEADAMVSEDPDFHRRDLYHAIAAGNAPEWRLELQIMPFAAAADYRFNPFDVTKVWPHADPADHDRPPGARPQPANHFAESRAGRGRALEPGAGDRPEPGQDADGPHALLPRQSPAPNRANYEQLPINAPKSPVNSYNKDGAMTYRHAGSQPVYAPTPPSAREQTRARHNPRAAWRRGRSADTQTSNTPRRRLRPGSGALPRRDERYRSRAPRDQHRRPREQPHIGEHAARGDRLLDERRPAARRARGGRARVPRRRG
jgi:catalase